jgi:hypothetical protein
MLLFVGKLRNGVVEAQPRPFEHMQERDRRIEGMGQRNSRFQGIGRALREVERHDDMPDGRPCGIFLAGVNGEDGIGRPFDDAFDGASKQDMLKPRPSLRPKENQVRRINMGGCDDSFAWDSLRLGCRNLESALLQPRGDLFEPSADIAAHGLE